MAWVICCFRSSLVWRPTRGTKTIAHLIMATVTAGGTMVTVIAMAAREAEMAVLPVDAIETEQGRRAIFKAMVWLSQVNKI